MSADLSRRGFFTAFRRPFVRKREAAIPATGHAEAVAPPVAKVAVVQGRFCLALTSFCSACVERCPVPGAMKQERGLPMVVGDVCTGCGLCQEICPAPRNAVLMMPRRQSASPHPA